MESNESEGSSDLSPRQMMVIPLLLSCTTIREAAENAKIGQTKIFAWLKDPVFKKELERQRSLIIEMAVNKLKYSMTEAAVTLTELLHSDNDNVRRAASNDILNHVTKFTELFDFEQRLKTLEAIGGDK